jgi:hypothetical protein
VVDSERLQKKLGAAVFPKNLELGPGGTTIRSAEGMYSCGLMPMWKSGSSALSIAGARTVSVTWLRSATLPALQAHLIRLAT